MKCVVNTPDWSYIITKNILCNLLHWFLRNKTKVLHCPNSPQLYSTLIHTDHEEDKCDKWRSYNIPCSIKLYTSVWYGAALSGLAMSTLAIWSRVVQSRDVSPNNFDGPRCPVPRFQSPRSLDRHSVESRVTCRRVRWLVRIIMLPCMMRYIFSLPSMHKLP